MDNNKDKQRFEAIALSIDSKQIRTNPFGENKSGERAYRRAERLVAALHLVTNHVPEDEPLRRRIRSLGPDLLTLMLEGKDEMRSSGSTKMRAVSSVIRELISLVRMLAVAGLLSQQNAEILTDALDDLWQFVSTSQKSFLSESVRLSREDFMDVRDQKGVSFIKDITDTRSNKDTVTIKDTENLRASAPENTTRGESIIEVLRTGGILNISDIAANLPEFSEKMIQRTLLDLVLAGRVKKIGEKRWSRYVLS
jgi:hypothetical protein